MSLCLRHGKCHRIGLNLRGQVSAEIYNGSLKKEKSFLFDDCIMSEVHKIHFTTFSIEG